MPPDSSPKRVLFLCTGNSCRSQMAEAWARRLLGRRAEAFSAGTKPKTVDPRAVAVMDEVGLDMSGGRSKHVDEVAGPFDLIVTVCGNADQACPTLPGMGRRVHRGFDDPPALAAGAAGDDQALPHYRRVRDEIRAFIEDELPGLLGVEPPDIDTELPNRG